LIEIDRSARIGSVGQAFERLIRIRNWPCRAVKAQFRASLLADVCGVSPRTLERFFVHHCQTTPQKWLDQLRDLWALKLATRGARGKEIAHALYYKQASHFCRHFKRTHGSTLKIRKHHISRLRNRIGPTRNAPS